MRLDLFLKTSRLIKRRTVAKLACDGGKVLVNGKICKASFEVKPNDVLEIQIKQPPVKVCVLTTEKKIGKNLASEMFQII